MRWIRFVIIMVIIGLLVGPLQAAKAEGEGIHREPLLELTADSPAIKLSAFAANANISCDAESCSLVMEQTYWLHNSADDSSQSLAVGLTRSANEWDAEQVELVFGGQTQTPEEGNEFYTSTWQMQLQPDQHVTLVLRYRHTLGKAAVLGVSVALDRIVAVWGLPDGARVRLVLSEPIGDDAILWMVPFISQFDGTQLAWDYETPRELINHQLVFIRPDVWHQLKSAAGQDNQQLAQLYLRINEAIQPLQLAGRDYFGQAVAAYNQAIAQHPDNPALYTELAQAYHTRAQELPDEGQNYELLALQTLEHAVQLAPNDSQLAEQLAQSYYAVAVASANQGQQEVALAYLEKLRTSGLPQVESEDNLLTLSLRWSVELAEKGYNQVAYTQARNLLPAETLQLLQDSAPPFIGVSTVITMDEGMRTAAYRIITYPGTADRTFSQISTVLEQLKGIPGLVTTSTQSDQAIVVTLEQPYNTIPELQQSMKSIRERLGQDNNLVTGILGIPWESSPELAVQNRAGLRSSTRFIETFSSSGLETSWKDASQFAEWRLVEMTNSAQNSELEELQRRLVTYLLKEQQQVWRQLPNSTSWEYHLNLASLPDSSKTWLMSWGEDRTFEVNQTVYNRTAIASLAGLSLGLVVLAILALLFPWHTLRR
ncbi:MAG: hypothetical protein ACYC6L_04410 [Anaerolineae bacterium]